MKKILRIFVLFISFYNGSIYAQEVKVSGKVFDSETREPLPFVSVKCKEGELFTTTDVDGNFSFTIPQSTDSLQVSFIGFITQRVSVRNLKGQSLSIFLKADEIMLNEVVILPGENPALSILRSVIAHKEDNNVDKLIGYQYEVYNKIEFDLNNIPPEWKDRAILKPIKFVFDYIDSTNLAENPYLPLFLTESVSKYYFRSSPVLKKEIITAHRASGIQDQSLAQFMGEMYQKVNIYKNNILLFGKQFPSPISDNALMYYKYYLIDSMTIGNSRCFQLQFKPRRRQELAFEGNLWIADTVFAIRRLEMSFPKEINLNFVKSMNVVQEYLPVPMDTSLVNTTDSMQHYKYMLSRDRLVVDFKLNDNKKKSKQPGFYGRKTTSYRDFSLNQPYSTDFYSRVDNVIIEENSDMRDDSFWQSARHDTLSKNERQIYKIVDTVKTLPVYRTWYDLIYIFFTGYKPIGKKLEVGPYFKLYTNNLLEGHRFRLGARTSNHFSKWYELNGYGAYGTKDKVFKYGVGLKSFISKKPRQLVYLNYKNDLEILGQNSSSYSNDNILTSVFRRSRLNNLTGVEEWKAGYEYEPFPGLNGKIFLIKDTYTPKGTQQYVSVPNRIDTFIQSNIISTEVNLGIRFAYGEKYIDYTFKRTRTGSRYPILEANYTYGPKAVLNSHYEFHKLALKITDKFHLFPLFGRTDYLIEAGKIWGKVPYPLFELHAGNESFIYDPHAFNMMNYYEFASDEYITAQIFHHFDGFFLNHIPLMRKLKWREVIAARALMGNISQQNKSVMLLPSTMSTINRKPYCEVSAGIENIFKVFRVDALWRITYIDKEYEKNYRANGGPRIPRFAVMGSIQIVF